MKKNKTFILLTIFAMLFCSCGEDRTAEFNELTKENQWIYSKMKEVYLWAGEIGDVSQKNYFSTPAQFFGNLLNKSKDNASFFSSDEEESVPDYGISYTMLRDPLGVSPSRQYALISYVEPNSVAKAAGLERGMWVAEIDGKRVNTTNIKKITSGTGAELKIDAIEYNDDTEEYFWENVENITLPASADYDVTPVPVVTIIDEITSKSGYILCNKFDNEKMSAALSEVLSGEVDNIILDLRYNTSTSLTDAAQVASAFIPADKEGTAFCLLDRNIDAEEKESIALPAASTNASDKPLYIVTTQKTGGVVDAFIKGIQTLRGTTNVIIVGQPSSGTHLYTECYESPYLFKINPATAYICDPAGEFLTTPLPDYVVDEYSDYRHVYPLGNRQEYIIYNVNYIIANGTLPPAAE